MMSRIVNGIDLDAYTMCPRCANETYSYISTWGDKPVSCMGCKGSKEPGKHNVRHDWQDYKGKDTRGSGLYDLRCKLEAILENTVVEDVNSVKYIKDELRKLLD